MDTRTQDLIPPAVRKQWDAKDAREIQLKEQMRAHCADALASIADAIRFPGIARTDLEAAQVSVMKALSIAAAIDPE